ncbi:hypothetical protein EB118_08520 [bacterium]|nr:hypothetical protein [bacterium]NDC94608.1 hypothetical protein [bacterium]NDD84493.1 hypothetical protein [bacterium]NDG30107.1 hypothetical protein [bacterium]
MSGKNFQPITFAPTANSSVQSKEIYDGLREDLLSSKHGNRFELREFEYRPSQHSESPFNVDVPYLPPIDCSNEHRTWLAGLAGSLVMRPQDWEALQEGFKIVYGRDDVKKHLSGGGVLKVVDSHRTYTGQVVQEIASWLALQSNGVSDAHEIQTTIASRATTLFRLGLLATLSEAEGRLHHNGAIIEDVLLRFGGVLLTIPNSASGNRLIEKLQDGLQTRTDIVSRTKIAHEKLVRRGGRDGQIFFEGSSGFENEIKNEGGIAYREIGIVRDRTAALTTDYNQIHGVERVMMLPVFMESDPYTGDPNNPIQPSPTPFAILEPRFPKKLRDIDEAMSEMAAAGTIVKASGQLPYRYGRHAVVGRRIKPRIIFKHTI